MSPIIRSSTPARSAIWEQRILVGAPLIVMIMVMVGISWSTPLLHSISLGKYQAYIDTQLEHAGISISVGTLPLGSNRTQMIDCSAGIYDEESNQTRWNMIRQGIQWLINQTKLFDVNTVSRSPPPPPVPILAPGASVVWWFTSNGTTVRLIIGIEIS